MSKPRKVLIDENTFDDYVSDTIDSTMNKLMESMVATECGAEVQPLLFMFISQVVIDTMCDLGERIFE